MRKYPMKIKKCTCGCKRPKLYSKLSIDSRKQEDDLIITLGEFPFMECTLSYVKCNKCGKVSEVYWGRTWTDSAILAIGGWNNDNNNT